MVVVLICGAVGDVGCGDDIFAVAVAVVDIIIKNCSNEWTSVGLKTKQMKENSTINSIKIVGHACFGSIMHSIN